MVTQADLIKAEIARIERELEEARERLERLSKEPSNGEPPPFTKLRGILKGKVHFTEEEIDDLKLRSRET